MSTEALPSAAVSLEEIVAKNPTTALYLPLAERLLSRGLVAEAIRLCEERRNRPGKGVGDFIVLGRCYLADGRLAEARSQFEGALAIDRENVIALKSLAGILSHEGRHAEAADLYRAVCRVDPGDLESQTALHQITSGDFPEVRPPEVIVSQGDTTWQPVRVSREEDHLPELALGLRTLGPLEAGPVESIPRTPPHAPAAPPPAQASPAAAPEAAQAPAREPERPASTPEAAPEMHEPIFAPDELAVGPSFPKEPGAVQPPAPPAAPPAAPAQSISKDLFQESLSGLDVGAFQESALERLEAAFQPIEARPLGEVAPPVAEPAEPPTTAPEAAAVVEPMPAPAKEAPPPQPAAARPAAPAAPSVPARPAAPIAPAEGSKVEGNRSAFERWLHRIGGQD